MTIRIKDMVLGEGRPKICIPLVNTTPQALLETAGRLSPDLCDLIEWRADWMEDILRPGYAEKIAEKLKKEAEPLPLLFTFRTSKEGGHLPASLQDYHKLTAAVISSGIPDLADIELFSGAREVKELIRLAHDQGVKTILSSHDFSATPSGNEILARLKQMEESGADIAKIAVTPQSPRDVLTLLEATLQAKEQLSCPVITMSMKGLGMPSRFTGEIFGSCLTFGTAGQASAPGQADAGELKAILELIHNSL